MNAQQFLTWMRNPGTTSREESAQLDALLEAFPYFQSGHLLYIKNLHNQGSFLYNNQLKTAAAYAVNRKVLYELIKQPAVVQLGSMQSDLASARSEKNLSNFGSAQSDKDVPVENKEEVSVPPKFPPKKFTSNPDEWEAGMLRQLQLLHHWRNQSDSMQSDSTQSDKTRRDSETPFVQRNEEAQTVSETADEQKTPAAKEEINTLLYVLVEPGQSEDLPEEHIEETSSETVTEESENTQWEIQPAEVKPEEVIVKPTDAVQQDILVEAIHSTFELEVDDTIPSMEELKPFHLEPIAEPSHPSKSEPAATEENVVNSFENMSFSEWLHEVNKKVPAPLPKTVLSEDKLIEKFIQEEPRIKGKKPGFFNPVNMAKKSVQESDEFITETLARIYAKQGNHTKAIRAYQKLSLKFPEKTAYFAALIEELKRTPNK